MQPVELDGVVMKELADIRAAAAADRLEKRFDPPCQFRRLGDHGPIAAEHQLVEMRENIMPILEARGVDMVFSGHSHIYERSMLIDGAYATPTTAEGATR